MPLTFPFHYLVAVIFIQQLVPINLCFLYTTPHTLAPFCSSFLALLFPLIYSFDWHSRSFFLLYFPSQLIFCFNWHIPFTTYLPFFVLFLSCFVSFVITCTTFLPFPSFSFIIPLSNAASLMSTLPCLYHFYPSSTLYLLLPFFFKGG